MDEIESHSGPKGRASRGRIYQLNTCTCEDDDCIYNIIGTGYIIIIIIIVGPFYYYYVNDVYRSGEHSDRRPSRK